MNRRLITTGYVLIAAWAYISSNILAHSDHSSILGIGRATNSLRNQVAGWLDQVSPNGLTSAATICEEMSHIRSAFAEKFSSRWHNHVPLMRPTGVATIRDGTCRNWKVLAEESDSRLYEIHRQSIGKQPFGKYPQGNYFGLTLVTVDFSLVRFH